MKYLLKIMVLFVVFMTVLSCKQQQARMPISRSSGTFMKESAVRNKKLVAGEEGKIDSIIKSNPKIKYFASKRLLVSLSNKKRSRHTASKKVMLLNLIMK